MELIRISCDKIKITLSSAELKEYDLTVEELNGGKERTEKAFRELLIYARNETGFEAEGEKLFAQIFRAKNGGCEIFISRIVKERRREPETVDTAYIFSDLDRLISACRAISRLGAEVFSGAYIGERGYLLVLYAPSETASAYASEWGERIAPPSKEYLAEHYSVIRENTAVRTLGSL